MTCWQEVRERAGRLGLNLRYDLANDQDIQKELRAKNHEEAHQKINAMSDQEFIAFVKRLQARKRRSLEREEEAQVYA